jgi:hypothetical protein
MTHQVVVGVEGELSEHDASAAVAHHAAGDALEYHLLIATRQVRDSDGGLAMLGVRSGDTFGSAALARRMHVRAPEDHAAPESDFGKIMTRSASHLRAASGSNVSVAITHADILTGVRTLVEATDSQEVVIVVGPGRYPQFSMPEWRQKLSAYFNGAQVRSIQHSRDVDAHIETS